jgi:hypothetical protein
MSSVLAACMSAQWLIVAFMWWRMPLRMARQPTRILAPSGEAWARATRSVT